MPLVYDVYGTLLDVNAAARIAADEKGMEKFKPLAAASLGNMAPASARPYLG